MVKFKINRIQAAIMSMRFRFLKRKILLDKLGSALDRMSELAMLEIRTKPNQRRPCSFPRNMINWTILSTDKTQRLGDRLFGAHDSDVAGSGHLHWGCYPCQNWCFNRCAVPASLPASVAVLSPCSYNNKLYRK